MNCQEVLEHLQAQLDGQPKPAREGLQAHLTSCPACTARCLAARRLAGCLPLLTPAAPPAELAPRISSKALRHIRRRRLVRRGALVGALAAGLLVALGIRALPVANNLDGRVKGDPPIAQRAQETPTDVVGHADRRAAPLRNAVEEAGNAVASLTSRTADEALDQTRLLLPLVSSPSLKSLEIDSADSPARPLRDAGQNLSSGLGPVASSARRAVNLFLREIPPVGSQNERGL